MPPESKSSGLSQMLNNNPVLALLALATFGGGTGVTVSEVFDSKVELDAGQLQRIAQFARPDPFTGSDARGMETRLTRAVAVMMCQRLRLLRVEMPPPETRERVETLEDAMRQLNSEFKPSRGWGDLGPPCPDIHIP